jgi:hypothetical protein
MHIVRSGRVFSRANRFGGESPRSAGLSLLAAALLITLPVQTALAWGRQGHRVASRLTEARLTAGASAAVRDLLDSGESLSDASTWADEHRREMPESAPWHYVNVPLDKPRYDPKFCPPQGCVVSKIKEFRDVLADKTASREERQKALRFLVHFVQDMHQPVHVGHRDDRGGNDLQLQFFGEGTNLHRIWDSGLIARAGGDEVEWARKLAADITDEQAKTWAEGTVEDWATESLLAARKAYRVPGSDDRLKAGMKLGEEYQEANLPVVRLRLSQAGVRLAAMLNEALK